MKKILRFLITTAVVGAWICLSCSPARSIVAVKTTGFTLPQGTETDRFIQEGVSFPIQGKFDEALAVSVKASALSPDAFRPHVLAASAYSGQQKMKSAS